MRTCVIVEESCGVGILTEGWVFIVQDIQVIVSDLVIRQLILQLVVVKACEREDASNSGIGFHYQYPLGSTVSSLPKLDIGKNPEHLYRTRAKTKRQKPIVAPEFSIRSETTSSFQQPEFNYNTKGWASIANLNLVLRKWYVWPMLLLLIYLQLGIVLHDYTFFCI